MGAVRGIAVLLAAGAAWILVTRRVPAVTRRPFPAPPRPALVAAAAATGILTGLLALGILAVPAAAGAVAALAAAVPFSVAGARRRRAVEELADAWPDVLARMRARIASGAVSYKNLRGHENPEQIVWRLRLEKKKRQRKNSVRKIRQGCSKKINKWAEGRRETTRGNQV